MTTTQRLNDALQEAADVRTERAREGLGACGVGLKKLASPLELAKQAVCSTVISFWLSGKLAFTTVLPDLAAWEIRNSLFGPAVFTAANFLWEGVGILG